MKRSKPYARAATAGVLLAFGVFSLALSAANPVEERQAAMKAVGQSMKEAAALKSPAKFDAAKTKVAMEAVAGNARKLRHLYPPGSDKDPKTAADPKIWKNKADFDKRLSEMDALATAASKASTPETYRPALNALGDTCKSCHDVYRMKVAGQ